MGGSEGVSLIWVETWLTRKDEMSDLGEGPSQVVGKGDHNDVSSYGVE
jgi:hypothetical protein